MSGWGVRGAAFTALAAAGWLTAQASAQSVDEIVAKHIEARGGYERLKAVQTIRMTRTVATPFSTVAVVVYKKRAGLLRVEQTPKGGATSARGVNTEAAWDAMPNKLILRPDRGALEAREIEADFDGLLVDWKAKGHSIELVGTESFASKPAYRLRVTTKGGFVRDLFIDSNTYLEIGMSGKALLPMANPKTGEHGTQDSTFVYSDYRDVEGLKFPFAIDEDRTAGPITHSLATYTHKIEVNVPMNDELFATPSK